MFIFQPCDYIAAKLLLENASQVSLVKEIQTDPQKWVDEVIKCGSVMERVNNRADMPPSSLLKPVHE